MSYQIIPIMSKNCDLDKLTKKGIIIERGVTTSLTMLGGKEWVNLSGVLAGRICQYELNGSVYFGDLAQLECGTIYILSDTGYYYNAVFKHKDGRVYLDAEQIPSADVPDKAKRGDDTIDMLRQISGGTAWSSGDAGLVILSIAVFGFDKVLALKKHAPSTELFLYTLFTNVTLKLEHKVIG